MHHRQDKIIHNIMVCLAVGTDSMAILKFLRIFMVQDISLDSFHHVYPEIVFLIDSDLS